MANLVADKSLSRSPFWTRCWPFCAVITVLFPSFFVCVNCSSSSSSRSCCCCCCCFVVVVVDYVSAKYCQCWAVLLPAMMTMMTMMTTTIMTKINPDVVGLLVIFLLFFCKCSRYIVALRRIVPNNSCATDDTMQDYWSRSDTKLYESG